MALRSYIRIKQPVTPMEKRAPYMNASAERLQKLVIDRMSLKKSEGAA